MSNSSIRRVKIGIIGMGLMGQMYARLAQENAEAELVAICEKDSVRRKELEQRLAVDGYEDCQTMLDRTGVDAVIVATPDFLHAEPVIQAANKDLHLMVEKPLATDLEQARQMRDAVRRSKGINMMAHVFRWSAPFAKAKASLDSGDLGAPLAMNMRIDDRIYVPTQMLRWAASTTPAWFLLSHASDLACWYAGSTPAQVYATGVKKKLASLGIDTYDLIHLDIRFENGFIASLEACWTLPNSLPNMSGSWCTLISTGGGQYINVMDQMIHQVGERYETPATLRVEMYGRIAGLQTFMFQSFLDSILRDKPVITTVEDGYTVVSILESAHRSLASGGAEKVNL